jgi:hypothetical protein
MTFMHHHHLATPDYGLDVLESLAEQRGWALERLSNGDLLMESVGEMSTYALQFTWSAQYNCLHITCSMDMRLPDTCGAAVNDLLAAINAKLWIGHFAIMAGLQSPAFRHTVLMQGPQKQKAKEIEEIIEIALGECERFYPAFQLTAFNNMPAHQAMDCALMECVGQA